MGKTIFFSTHILADVAEICTQVGIIEAGQLVASGPLEELQQHILPHRQVRITLLGSGEKAIQFLEGVSSVQSVQRMPGNNHEERTRLEIAFLGDDSALSEILASLVDQGFPVIQFNEESRDLEEVFLRATKGLVT